ncbi:mechanosensitive ion channel family protein [Shewanella intestini]|uniref:Small-conductance mechanosensitive channel n=1 Tax=Shewanella intestini TaxID=2017544 RepID=A0ABS5I1J6_9GAMM|nr:MULTISPECIES: mechanosensitive ion channel family protein [Shewanella]MBR9727559.1 mechanosensitive ion channel family protein [Shewanella intestini]MRG35291.1 mechanosensitive ion channel [Shewanella sp. XMDDZSB0408]
MNQPNLEQEFQQLQGAYDVILEFLVQYSFQLFGALVIFILGLWVANKVSNMVAALLTKHNIDITLTNFTSNLIRIIIVVMVAIICLGKLGISVTPMVAAIGAASLGAGLALQGMLSNYAAGITIIVTRPFVVGNTIEIQGVSGVVETIKLGLTILTNEEGEQISIPNKHIVGEILHNSFEYKLVETKLNVEYEADTNQAISIIEAQLQAAALVNQQQKPLVGVNGFNNLGIEIGIRYWVPTPQYFEVKYQTNLAIINALKQANISIPCPLKNLGLPQ